MSRDDPRDRAERLFCDLTQSWSAVGGGVGTYLRHKREHILGSTAHRHLLIVPGQHDKVETDHGGRAVTVTIASPRVPGSPNYRLLLRNGAVREALEQFDPDLIECQDAYNLPWTALGHARRNPGVATVAAYMTDFPTVYVERPFEKTVGGPVARAASRLCYRYCHSLYRRFDALYGLSENGGVAKLRSLGLERIEVVPLGVELGDFSPARRSAALRASLGLGETEPLLIYVGRLDSEKRARTVVDAFRQLPQALGAQLLLLGDGPLREEFLALGDPRLHAPGFVRDRGQLADWLASADLYVSGMADETFGISIVEAQASGLPVVGVAAGAMIDRVTPDLGRLGPVDDPAAMAVNIAAMLAEKDRSALARRAVAMAHSYGWDRSMDSLFNRIYPMAFRRAARRDARLGTPVAAALADA